MSGDSTREGSAQRARRLSEVRALAPRARALRCMLAARILKGKAVSAPAVALIRDELSRNCSHLNWKSLSYVKPVAGPPPRAVEREIRLSADRKVGW